MVDEANKKPEKWTACEDGADNIVGNRQDGFFEDLWATSYIYEF